MGKGGGCWFFEPKEEHSKGYHTWREQRLFSVEWPFSIEGGEALEAVKNNEISEEIFLPWR